MSLGQILTQGLEYLSFRARAGTAHGLHSPYIYGLYNGPILRPPATPATIQAARKALLVDSSLIHIQDFGAGSRADPRRLRAVSDIARTGLMPGLWADRLAGLLSQLSQEGAPAQKAGTAVLELGTSLGLTTARLALADPSCHIYTLEGCPETLARAQALWRETGAADQITPIAGPISDTLPGVLDQIGHSGRTLRLAILDAHHEGGPVMAYYRSIAPALAPGGVLVVDDLYWSPSMASAWREICHQALSGPGTPRQTIDLFRQGWILNRPGQAAEAFTLRCPQALMR